MKIILKREKGITLIALVVTIVVLLILAGVSISMLTGENGIIKQAQNSKEETRGGAVEEARDLWRADKQSDELTNSDTAQTLDELLNDLVKDKLLSEEEKEEIKETGKVTIGSRTIEFDLTKKLDIFPSVRAIEYRNQESKEYEYKIGIVCEVSVSKELIQEYSYEMRMIELAKELEIPEEGDLNNLSVEQKENILNNLVIFLYSSNYEDTELENIISSIGHMIGITEECKTWEDLYNAAKNKEIENNPNQEIPSYEEFINFQITELIPICKEGKENIMEEWITSGKYEQTINENIAYFWNGYITFEYTITKPDGNKIVDYIDATAKTFYGPWIVIEIPIEEFGEYKIKVNALGSEFEGLGEIKYSNDRYFATWDGRGSYVHLFDTQEKQLVDIDKTYMYLNGEKIQVTDQISYILLIELNDKGTPPFEIEMFKNDENVKIPVLITRSMPM